MKKPRTGENGASSVPFGGNRDGGRDFPSHKGLTTFRCPSIDHFCLKVKEEPEACSGLSPGCLPLVEGIGLTHKPFLGESYSPLEV
jgi:hypothetical protein